MQQPYIEGLMAYRNERVQVGVTLALVLGEVGKVTVSLQIRIRDPTVVYVKASAVVVAHGGYFRWSYCNSFRLL